MCSNIDSITVTTKNLYAFFNCPVDYYISDDYFIVYDSDNKSHSFSRDTVVSFFVFFKEVSL